MSGFIKIVLLIVVTLLGMIALTSYSSDWTSVGQIAGYPIVSIQEEGARGLIAIGQADARGVVVFAQVGFGLITFAQGGVGILFGMGQGVAGLIAIGQLAFGLWFALGQVALGTQCMGQVGFKSRAYFSEMGEELNELLKFTPPDRTLEPQKVLRKAKPISPQRLDARGWPHRLLKQLQPSEYPTTLEIEGVRVHLEADAITIEGEKHHSIREEGDAVVQLSYSKHRRKGFARFTGRFEHRLHAEVRNAKGLGFKLYMPATPEWIEDIPYLEQSGTRVDPSELSAVLALASALQLRVAHNPSEHIEIEEVPLQTGVRVLTQAKMLIRPAVKLIYVAPVLLIAKLFLLRMEPVVNDWITVAYVALVVYFFAMLAVLACLHMLVGPRSKRFKERP